jgi:branched-chain amino acid transport system substrate-binding protein
VRTGASSTCGRLLLAATLITLAACTGSTSDATPFSPTPSSTTPTVAVDDGVLTIGLLIPLSGDGALLGRSIREGVSLAIADVNAAGGVQGSPVRLAVREEGQSNTETQSAIEKLQESGVDAIIGPISSVVALTSLDQIVDRDLVACSPTATAQALDDFPDRGLFFRTIASDSLQAAAIAQEVERTGTTRAAVAYINDAYGRPLADALQAELADRGITVSLSTPFDPDSTSTTDVAQAVATDAADTVVVLAAASDGPAMLAALTRVEGGRTPTYVVNGAQQGEALSAVAGALGDRLRGVRAVATGANPDFDKRLALNSPGTAGLYALNAYDCATLLALAAESGAKRSMLSSVAVAASTGGSNCASFAECAGVIRSGRNVDYEGPGGRLALTSNGTLANAVFEVFSYDETGRIEQLDRLSTSY